MKFKDCFQSSEHLEIKTSRSFSLFKSVFFFFKRPINLHFLKRLGYIVMVEMPVMYIAK